MTRLWLACVFVACGWPAPREVPGGGVVPHPPDIEQVHGAQALAPDAGCEACHAAHEPEVSAGPACDSCHAYPHTPVRHGRATHGASWHANPELCVDCHGPDGRRAPGGDDLGRCTACHSTFPHVAGWAAADAHGTASLAQGGVAACRGCHPTDAPDRPGACESCHATWPHPSGYPDHGSAYRADPAACGQVCHGHEAPTAPPSCARCHDTFPHAAEWPRVHAGVVQRRGETGCTTCHATGTLTGPAIPGAACGPGCHPEGP